jgi:hypothetical protein
MSLGPLEMLMQTLDLIEQRPEIQENSPMVEDAAQSDNRDYLPAIEEFLFNLNADNVGVEKFGPYTVHFEGFSDYCQQDANDRCHLPKEDPRHLDKYEDIYDEVLRDFINREDGKMPIDSGLIGDEEYPIYYAIFKEEDTLTEDKSINTVAYHGSIDDITEFRPFSHFGSEQAAHDRMDYKKVKNGKVYKVELNINNPLTIKDFPGVHYDRLYAFELRDKKLISQEEMEYITTEENPQELRKRLLDKLRDLGIDGFVYKNRYEDKGNLSYVIVDPRQAKITGVEEVTLKEEVIDEASPNTLEGSFTPDLVESKKWLCDMLAKGLGGKNAGTIYVLGSWYGNMGIFLQEADIKFDELVLVEPNEEWLRQSKKLLDKVNRDGKIVFLNQKAEDIVYEKPGVVINTSCNETGPIFLTKVPDNMLCLLQARNNIGEATINTDSLEEFDELFNLSKVYYTGEKTLNVPETEYARYMKIGRK